MNRKPISRRTVLRGLGTAVALPFLEAMTPGSPLIASPNLLPAKTIAPPVRSAFLYVPNGMHMADWTPPGVGRQWEMPKILQAVADFQDQMNLISGLALDGARALGDGGGDHARSVAAFLTGAHPKKTNGTDIKNGKSVDQVAADAIGHLTRFPSLELGTEQSAPAGNCDSGYSCVYTSNISWRTETSPLAKEVNPALVFARLFGSGNGREDRNALARKEQKKLSILDFVNDEARSLRQRLGVRDRQKMDEYLHAVRSLERQILATDALDKREDGIPDYPRPAGVPADYGAHVQLLLDMIVLAFQTDSTRTISFMYANAGSNRSYPNLGISAGHHALSHHGGSDSKQQQISKINTFHAQLLRRFLKKLSLIEEQGRPLLDQCMVVYGSGIEDGNSHRHSNLPIALFGKGGGTIATGRHLKLKEKTPLTNLYLSMLQRMGVEVDSFSDSTGILSELDG